LPLTLRVNCSFKCIRPAHRTFWGLANTLQCSYNCSIPVKFIKTNPHPRKEGSSLKEVLFFFQAHCTCPWWDQRSSHQMP
jgi:hypothetical protein